MIKLTTVKIVRQPNGILDLKRGYNETCKNMPTVSEDLLRIVWKCMKIALIIHLYTHLFQILLRNKQKSIRNSCNSNLSLTP